MKKPIYIVCFYWEGDRWRENKKNFFPEEVTPDLSYQRHLRRVGPASIELVNLYINNLYKGFKKWATDPFEFICFCNDDNDKLDVLSDIDVRPFPMISKLGVLPRLWVFSEEAGLFGHQVLCLDIDVIITGNLHDILSYDGLFAVRPRWQRREAHLPDGDIISFRAGKETEDIFWSPFIKDIKAAEEQVEGRERHWITERIGDRWTSWDQVAPGQVVSYKHHILRREGIGNARIVSCHGFPRPHQITEEWRKENWPIG